MTLYPVCRHCQRAAVWSFVILLAVTTPDAATVVGTTTVSSSASCAFATTYLARAGHGPRTYQRGSTSCFAVAYGQRGTISDPGPFVSLVPVPEPSSILLARSGGAVVAAVAICHRRLRLR